MTRGVAVPPQFPPDSSARIVLLSVAVPILWIPPPKPAAALLPEKVLLVTVSEPTILDAAAESPDALLPEKVLLVTVSVPSIARCRRLSSPALLPEKVLLVTVSVPWLSMPPPRLRRAVAGEGAVGDRQRAALSV